MSILVCGEALYDVFQTESGAEGRLTFEARPGGSPFNVACGIARLGGQAALLTGLSTDTFGARLLGELQRDGVNTGYLQRNARRTTLSVVGLDPGGSPDYAFYGTDSADCGLTEADMPPLGPEIRALHLGSYPLVVPPVADALAALALRHRGLFLSLDPNIRPTIAPDMALWRARIDGLRPHARLIKVSAEDLALLTPGRAPIETARAWAAEHPCLVVLTAGPDSLTALLGETVVHVTPPAVEVVDTVGAGDAVQASLLAGLQRLGAFDDGVHALAETALRGLLEDAARRGAQTCAVRGARI
ncbi:MAG: carbohydrate kinase [Pseudomonadota bacterium]